MSEAEEMLNELQMNNQQLQTVMIQKQALMIEDREIEHALEEMGKFTGDDIFKSVGPILVKTTKESVQKELKEGREENELKIRSLDKQEARIKQKIKSIQEKFQSFSHAGVGE